MMFRILLALIITATATSPASGQLKIRESFAAASQAEKPASFLWTVENTPEDVRFGTIETAVRYNFDCLVWGELVAGPTLELHKMTREKQKYDRYSAGGSGEFTASNIVVPWLGSPYFTGQIAYEYDHLSKKDGLAFSISGTFFSKATGAPGKQNKLWSNSMLRYYPCLGIEQYPALSNSVPQATLGFLQLNLEFWPLNGRIQGLATYIVATELGEQDLPDDLDRLSLSVNLYLDENERVGLGVEYIDAAQPKDGFTRAERMIFGFKVKL